MIDPLFVIGTGRSGTTITAKCLGAHPYLLFIDEPRFLNDILFPAATGEISVDEFAYRLEIYSDGSGKEPMKFFRRLEEHYGHKLGINGLNNIRQSTAERCWQFWHILPGLDCQSRLQKIRPLIMELMKLTEQTLGKPIWLIKQPDLSCHLEELAKIFPTAKFLHIFRSPEDVLASRIDGKFQANFDLAFQVWKNRLNSIAAFSLAHPELILHVRFEEIVENAERLFEEMLLFVGLSMSIEVRATASSILPAQAHIGRGKLRFNEAQEEQLQEACSLFLEVLNLDLFY